MRRTPPLLGLLALAGCTRDADVRTYSVPRVPPAVLAVEAHGPGDGHDHGAMPPQRPPMAQAEEGLAWTLPEGWRVSPEARSMRYATLLAGELEVPISRLAGDVGGRLPNLNRWRGQLGLPPVSEAELAQCLPPLEGAPQETLLMDATSGDGAQRMLVAMLPRPDASWFVKLVGPAGPVSAQRDAFVALLRSLRLEAGQPVAGPPSGGEVTFTTPEGWERLAAAPPRLATLRVEAAELSITRFPGAVGDELGNVNRWRQQVQLEPVAAVEARRAVDVGGHVGALWELVGPTTAILAVSVPVGDQTYFIKLMGPKELVARERARFEAFSGSVRFQGGS